MSSLRSLNRLTPGLFFALLLATGSARAQSSPSFRPPVLPFAPGATTTSPTPWGGPIAAKRLIEAHVANAASAAMNRAWARGNAPDDVVVAIPIRMLKMGNNENGDGQLNATVSFGSWSNPMRTDDAATNGTVLPPLVATLLRFSDSQDRIAFTLAPGALSNATNSLTIRYVNETGTTITMSLPASVGSDFDWALPNDLQLGAPLGRKPILVSLDGAKTWMPILFHIPIREIGEITSPPANPGHGATFMDTVPKDFLFYKDGHYIMDHEEVGVLHHPGDSTVPFARLEAKKAAVTKATPQGGFSIPYENFEGYLQPGHGLHNRIPLQPGGNVNNTDPSTYVTVSVGDFWNWTPFSSEQDLLQPQSVHYLCLDKRDPRVESDPTVARNGGVTTGANWHRVHLDFTRMGNQDVPLGGSETFFNDLENRSLFVGYATANANINAPPGGVYTYGLSDVATFRFVRPGEVFITPDSGTTEDSTRQTVDQSVYHAVFSYQEEAPACVEVWTPPCTPDANFGFSCGLTPVDITVKSGILPAGTKLAFRGTAQFAINVGSRQFLANPAVAGQAAPAANGTLEMLQSTTASGVQTWHAQVNLPQSMLIQYDIVRIAPNGTQTSAITSSFSVPVASQFGVDAPGMVKP